MYVHMHDNESKREVCYIPSFISCVKHNHGPQDTHSLHKKIKTNSPSVAVPSLHPHSFEAQQKRDLSTSKLAWE